MRINFRSEAITRNVEVYQWSSFFVQAFDIVENVLLAKTASEIRD